MAGQGVKDEKKPLRRLKPRECSMRIRERLAESFEEIVSGFVKQAKGGSCPHLKFICELLDSEPKVKPARLGSAEKMLAEWNKRTKGELAATKRLRGDGGKFVKREQGGEVQKSRSRE
jgi:hypothetical protein